MFVNDSNHVWHVAKTGNDANGGHAAQYPVNLAADAKLTIGAAITAAVAGDCLVVHPGIYVENVVISKSLTLIGMGRGKTVVQVATGHAIVFGSSDVVLRGFSAITTDSGVTYGIFAGNLYSNNVIADCYGQGDYDGIHMGSSDNWQLLNSHGKGKFDGIQAGSGRGGLVCNCIAETDGSNTIDAEVSAFVCGAVDGLRVEGLIAIARRSINGDSKHLNGVLIKGSAILKDVLIDVDHIGTGDHTVKGLSVDTSLGTCLIKQVKVNAKAMEGTLYGMFAGSSSSAVIQGGQVELHVPAPATASVCTDLTAVTGDEKKRFIDNTNPTPDVVPDDTYNGWTLFWTSGANVGQSQAILDWDTTLNEFTFAADFTYAIAVGDQYEIYVNAASQVIHDDLHNDGGLLVVGGVGYDRGNTSGIIENLSPRVDGSGRVDVGSINGDIQSAGVLQIASAVRANKAMQDKSTGTITLRNADDTSDQYVLTLTDDGSTIVREVSEL